MQNEVPDVLGQPLPLKPQLVPSSMLLPKSSIVAAPVIEQLRLEAIVLATIVFVSLKLPPELKKQIPSVKTVPRKVQFLMVVFWPPSPSWVIAPPRDVSLDAVLATNVLLVIVNVDAVVL